MVDSGKPFLNRSVFRLWMITGEMKQHVSSVAQQQSNTRDGKAMTDRKESRGAESHKLGL